MKEEQILRFSIPRTGERVQLGPEEYPSNRSTIMTKSATKSDMGTREVKKVLGCTGTTL